MQEPGLIKRLLVPLDGSRLAERVLPYVEEIARRADAEVILISAITPLATWDPGAGGVRWDREADLAGEYLEKVREEVAGRGVKARARICWGPAGDSIRDAAEEEAADLVAMTTHGRSGIARWALGSVVGKVISQSRTPLLVIRSSEEEQPARAIQKILVPLDGSQVSQSALPFIIGMAKVLETSLLLHHAITPPAMLYPGIEMAHMDARLAAEIEAGAQELLAGAADQVRAAGVSAETVVTTGFAVDEISRVAEERSADLIAMSTHGRSGLGRWVLGSVADAVLRRSTLPCLLVRPREMKEQGREEAAGKQSGRAAGKR